MRDKAYIIAEGEINHNGQIDTAIAMIKAAKESGANCIKFQYIIADEMADPSSEFHTLLKSCELSKDDFKKLKAVAEKDYGLDFMMTAPSIRALHLCQDLDIKKIKIGSSNLTNTFLLNAVSKEKDDIDIYFSVGMATLGEIKQALFALNYKTGDKNYFMFHCTSNYPAEAKNLNLTAIKTLKKEFDKIPVGYSDHTTDETAGIAARALGATLFEKHFTLDNNMKGPDHFFSTNPDNFKKYVAAIRSIESAMGDGEIKPAPSEITMKRKTQRFLVAVQTIKKGTKLESKMFATKRVGDVKDPIAVNQFDKIAQTPAPRNFQAGDILTWKDFDMTSHSEAQHT